MITFDGIEIGSVAKVYVEDIKVSDVDYSPVTRPRPIDSGALFVRNRANTRTVTVTFALLKQDRNARQAALTALNAWAKTDKEYKLELEGHPDHYLMAVCTEKPSPSLRQWWEQKLRFVFTCYDNPFWTSNQEKIVACGTQFVVLGDAPPLMTIHATGNSFALDGRTMAFSSASGSVIDLNTQTVTPSSVMSGYNVTSKWLIPRTGTQTISGSGTIRYRERWS